MPPSMAVVAVGQVDQLDQGLTGLLAETRYTVPVVEAALAGQALTWVVPVVSGAPIVLEVEVQYQAVQVPVVLTDVVMEEEPATPLVAEQLAVLEESPVGEAEEAETA